MFIISPSLFWGIGQPDDSEINKHTTMLHPLSHGERLFRSLLVPGQPYKMIWRICSWLWKSDVFYNRKIN